MNEKTKERIWFVFCIMFIISYLNINNFSIFRFIAIGMIQIVSIVYIIKNKLKIEYNKNIIILILIIILCMTISNFNTGNVIESAVKIISVLDLFVMTIILLPLFFKKMYLQNIVFSTSCAFGIVLLICAILYKNDYIYTYGMGRLGGETRLFAGFVHPDTLGLFSFMCFMGSLTIFFYYKHEMKKIKMLLVYFFTILSIYLMIRADCRTALLSSVLLVCLILFNRIFYKKEKMKLTFICLFIGIVILFLLINVDKISYDELNKILSYRLTYIERAIEDLKQNNNLMFGRGAYRNENTFETGAVLLDNGYVNTIYQFGFITFVFVMLFEIKMFLQIKQNTIGKEREILWQCFIIFLIYAIADNILINISSFFAIYMYTLISTKRIEEKDN